MQTAKGEQANRKFWEKGTVGSSVFINTVLLAFCSIYLFICVIVYARFSFSVVSFLRTALFGKEFPPRWDHLLITSFWYLLLVCLLTSLLDTALICSNVFFLHLCFFFLLLLLLVSFLLVLLFACWSFSCLFLPALNITFFCPVKMDSAVCNFFPPLPPFSFFGFSPNWFPGASCWSILFTSLLFLIHFFPSLLLLYDFGLYSFPPINFPFFPFPFHTLRFILHSAHPLFPALHCELLLTNFIYIYFFHTMCLTFFFFPSLSCNLSQYLL